ncbi:MULTISPECIES: XrtA/PEP-CTERM system histidine kinase PrsK [unclassified Agarivorans]|uniref:XrtA/PEP-CTERM system histidine kinase PrsK n=1 Tax=unclassified Agarivorans TaxID=2636026 RepID=UPI0026E13648|nr:MULTISPECIES: XrtA/PEP-CTERM system histidine kinase PrsK [unclassified Agarivorans]MDO6687724.1 PEP-CTERM system histidine kinase PrsK [Agarivorans sp. 3_MG-2023]MDO6717275.1 PEP-CTERM system histidine kinase PrsK [Agarivorans sp. 2_MG-2023]
MSIIVGLLGYSIAAVVYLLFSLLLLTTVQSGFQRKALSWVVFFTLLWAAVGACQIRFAFPLGYFYAVETIRNGLWFLLLYATIAPRFELTNMLNGPWRRKGVLLGLLITACLQLFVAISNLPLNQLWLVTQLAQTVIGLWLIEQLYRRIEVNARPTIKPMCLGLGGMFAFDFALYANALITSGISFDFWSLRGFVAVLAAPLVLLSARRIKRWSTKIYVSRDVIYHSTLLLVAGGYLLMMALVGYYIRYAGGDWGSMAQNGFFALSALILVSLFLSERLRKQLKVQITKHFFANKYEYREEWMKFAAVLEEDGVSPYNIALKAINQPFDCQFASLAIIENGRFTVKSCYNVADDDPQVLLCLEHLAFQAIEHQWIIDIDELKEDSSVVPFTVSSEMLQQVSKFSYLVPTSTGEGFKGVILLSSPTAIHSVNWEDRDLMRAISRQLAVFLNLHRSNLALAESQQFDTFNRMSAYLVHDLKNVLAQLQLMSKNAIKHKHNPEFIDDAFETVDSAANRLAKVVAHLSKKQRVDTVVAPFLLKKALQQVVESRSMGQPKPQLRFSLEDDFELVGDQERFINVLSHLVQNAQDATQASGEIMIKASSQDKDCIVEVEDNGEGMSVEFIDTRLFKPFDTTKGNAGMGVGAYDAKRFVEELGGHIQVKSHVGEGSLFRLFLPIHKI